MKTGRATRIGIFPLAAILLMTFPVGASGQDADTSAVSVNGRTIAMLPMANYSGDAQATEDVIPIVISTLEASGGIIGPGELRPILREHRIRAVGLIGRDGAEAIASDLGVEFLLLGSLDFYRAGDNPAIGFSLHMIHVPEMIPFWAVSVSATGDQFIGMLGRGGIGSVDSLATRLAKDAAGQMQDATRDRTSGGVNANSPMVAIVPFDDIDSDQPIGAIASSYLLTRLVDDGMRVVEPGVVRETFLEMNRAPRGEIDHELIDVLHDSLGVDVVITGAVDDFSVTPAGEGGWKADISFGARLIDANSHRIESAPYVIKQVQSRSGLLPGGADYPPAEVVTQAVGDVVGKFAISSPQTAADSR